MIKKLIEEVKKSINQIAKLKGVTKEKKIMDIGININ